MPVSEWITPGQVSVGQVWQWFERAGEFRTPRGNAPIGQLVTGGQWSDEAWTSPSLFAFSSRAAESSASGLRFAGAAFSMLSRAAGAHPARYASGPGLLSVAEFTLNPEAAQPHPLPSLDTWPDGAIDVEYEDTGSYVAPTQCTVQWGARTGRSHPLGSAGAVLGLVPHTFAGVTDEDSLNPAAWSLVGSLTDPSPMGIVAGTRSNAGPVEATATAVFSTTDELIPLGVYVPEQLTGLIPGGHPDGYVSTQPGQPDVVDQYAWYASGARISGFSADRLFQPSRYRWVFPAKGTWRLRQRQSLTGCESWPLRQRQNGGHTGSWAARSRQGGV